MQSIFRYPICKCEVCKQTEREAVCTMDEILVILW